MDGCNFHEVRQGPPRSKKNSPKCHAYFLISANHDAGILRWLDVLGRFGVKAAAVALVVLQMSPTPVSQSLG